MKNLNLRIMSTKKNKTVGIDAIVPDNANANRGTLEGKELLNKSFRELGAGRSILLDKNNRIIAGNKSTAAAIENGLTDVIVVETEGDVLVAVKRTDLDISTKKGRDMAIADNATGEKNLSWDESALQYITEKWGVETRDWGVETKEWGEGYKPNLNPTQQNSMTTQRDVERASEAMAKSLDEKKTQGNLMTVTCPKCNKEFDIKKF